MSSIVDVIEKCIGFPLEERYVSKYDISPDKLHELGFALGDFYENFTLPKRRGNEFRPYISANLTASKPLGMGYVFGEQHFSNQDNAAFPNYSFDADNTTSISVNVKKYLLFCHRLFIHDPIPYLLDYFRFDPTSEFALARLPAIKQLLIEYAQLKPLLKQKIVVPLSDEVFGTVFLNDTTLDREILNRIGERIRKQGREDLLTIYHAVVSNISHQQFITARVKDRIDLFFPNSQWITIFSELMKELQKQFSSKDVLEPFKAGTLGEITAVNPNAVSIKDIIKMRKNEELFNDWRKMMSSILRDLYENEGYYSDLDKEFIELARDRLDDWESKFKVKTTKKSVLKAFADSGEKLIFGAASGATTGALTGAFLGGPFGAVAGGALGALSPAAFNFIKSSIRIAYDRPKVALLRRHFVAIGVKDK